MDRIQKAAFGLSRNGSRGWCRLALFAASLTCMALSGCAAITNPTADAVPVRYVPPPLLEPSRNDDVTIPLPALSQCKPDVYRLEPGDVLGIWIEGILGDRGQVPPVQTVPPPLPEQPSPGSALGYPVPVRPDGTIALPAIDRAPVQGLTLAEVTEVLRDQYTVKRRLLQPGQERIIVTLLQPRRYEVLVIRQESSNLTVGATGGFTGGKRGTGRIVQLPAYENDVLHALAVTGGLPGLDTYNEVIIERGCFQKEADRARLLQQIQANPAACAAFPGGWPGWPTTVIPLRMRPGTPLPFHPEDVLLQNGDVVFLEARDFDLFYTAGLLPSGEHVLPRDRDLDVIEAITEVQGPLLNGAFATNNLAGNIIAPGTGGPSPSLLVVMRRTPGGGRIPIRVDLNRAFRDPRECILVRKGDILVLQEKPSEAVARYLTQTFFNFAMTWRFIHGPNEVGVADFSAPQPAPGRVGVSEP